MSIANTVIGGAFVVTITTFGIQAIAPEAPSASLPPAININEITIRADGTTVYDREILAPGVWQAWSGTIFDVDGIVHCRGGDLAQYHGPLPDNTAYDADWLVGDDCSGLTPGMQFAFTWTPIGPDYAPVRYPETGYGLVTAAD